uniref:Spectrin repeat containing nuclear envelope protein 1 n=1 Tax=Varanus komodoensis TaxID=61221 RepID=A0A8D2LVZ1_VARKO
WWASKTREKESVQKRTFTKWINTHLAKRKPPMVVNDLFHDIKDGIVLIALLEVLSGQKLPCEQGRKLKRIHGVANIGTALKFLEGRRIKLVNINSTDIADGRPSIVLGLVWTIILYFQIEELTSNLPQLQSLSSSTSSVDSIVSSETASPPSKRKVVNKVQGNARKALLKWVQYTAAKQAGIEVKDFGRSWRSGVAFHTVIHAIRPELVDLERVKTRSNRENLEEAFTIAESELGIPRLLDPEDVDVDKPDEKSIMTYIAQFLKHYPDPHNAASDAQETDHTVVTCIFPSTGNSSFRGTICKEDRLMLRDLKIWVEQFERDLTRAQMMEISLQEKYQSFKHFRLQYDIKRKQIELAIQSLRKDGKLSLDQALVKQAWDRVTSRLFEWHLHLDKSLPAPLGNIGAWLNRAETSLREEILIQQAHEETANMIHRKFEEHKVLLKNVDDYKKTFLEIHRARSVNGVPVPPEQLDDMAERFNFVASTSELHLLKMEFLELKYRLLSLLVLAESKLKSWIIKYGRRESVELLLQNYMSVIENNKFFDQYEVTYQILKKAAEMYAQANGSLEEIESVTRFMNETTTQWRHLSVEVRSVRSMLEEVISNWDRYSSTVASLQAWLEDAEKMLNQPEHAKKDFFRHLPQWIQQHTAMNDAGNFLIETCDETISRDLKQQLLLLNGRWRELFMQVKQYARADELDRMRKEYSDGIAALSAFTDEAKRKIHVPLEVSFLNVKMFVQELEDIKQKVPVMESQYKMVTRTGQLITKEIPLEEVNDMLATMSGIKGWLSKVNESCPVVLCEAQQLLPRLEELEKQITNFYESLDKVNEILSVLDPEVQPADIFKQQHQDLVAYQEHCKKALSLIERSNQSITKFVASSKALHHFSVAVLKKKVMEIQAAFQDMVKKTDDWKKNVEANSRLMKQFEDSRTELENVLQVAHSCLKERGNPEELLRKHTEFFSQLDQRVLNAFLKACDELTDILPEQEQHTLQEAVRKLHKQWKDLQSEAPYHLIHLKIEVEKSKFLASMQECRAELARQEALVSKESSEKIIREHKLFFGDKGPLQLCEKRLNLIQELCSKLPQWDSLRTTYETTQKDLSELKSQVACTYMELMDHPDKWKDYKNRFSELESWISSREPQLKKIKHGATDTAKYKHFKTSIEEIRQEACKQGEVVIWLKSRLAALSEVSSGDEAKKQGDELSKLSSDFKRLLSLLTEIEKTLGAVGDCVQFTEEVKGNLEDLITNSKEAQAEVEKIFHVESLLQAQQLLRYHQQKAKRLHAKRQDVQRQIAQGKQLQIEGGLTASVQEDLLKLESTLENMQQSMDERGDQLQITVNAWEQFERDKETIVKYLTQASCALERILSFSSLESLSSELEKTKELSKQTVAMAEEAENLVMKTFAIQLGDKSKQALQQQAKSIQEQIEKVEATLEEDIKTMEMVKNKWDQFGKNFEALSIWITEKEKELDALDTSSSPLDVQINRIKVIEIAEKENEIPSLEEDAQSFSQYLTSGESAHIKAKLTQIRRYREELQDHAHHLEGVITGKISVQQKFDENFTKVQQDLCMYEAKLAELDSSCSSSAESYKTLQDLMVKMS